MHHKSVGDAFQHLVNEFRQRHSAVCAEYNDPVEVYLARIERDIAKNLSRKYISLKQLHDYLNGNNPEFQPNEIPSWIQADEDLILYDRYPAALEPHRERIRHSLMTFLAENGFRSTVKLNLFGRRGSVRIHIHL